MFEIFNVMGWKWLQYRTRFSIVFYSLCIRVDWQASIIVIFHSEQISFIIISLVQITFLINQIILNTFSVYLSNINYSEIVHKNALVEYLNMQEYT